MWSKFNFKHVSLGFSDLTCDDGPFRIERQSDSEKAESTPKAISTVVWFDC
jgi:hypothetical protein